VDTLNSVLLPAAFGAAIQELAYWWELRFKLSSEKYKAQIRSPGYWIVVILMIGGSAIGTMYWFGSQNVTPKDALVLGAAFPLIFKHAVDTASSARRTLGVAPASGVRSVLRSYFSMR
jgi:hypothetical protein